MAVEFFNPTSVGKALERGGPVDPIAISLAKSDLTRSACSGSLAKLFRSVGSFARLYKHTFGVGLSAITQGGLRVKGCNDVIDAVHVSIQSANGGMHATDPRSREDANGGTADLVTGRHSHTPPGYPVTGRHSHTPPGSLG